LKPTPESSYRGFGRHLQLVPARAEDPQRAELESYVSAAFQRRHAATVQTFMPTLLAFRGTGGDLRGVVGLRGAGHDRLYLEHYLDAPIEVALGHASGRPIERSSIVEVGNLAGGNCRTAMRMVAQLPAFLLAHDYRWIVFTATSAVRGILQAFGAPLVELAAADSARVAGGADHWGSYYETDPRVFAGFLPDSGRISGFDRPGVDH
jgi:hypothetical protein